MKTLLSTIPALAMLLPLHAGAEISSHTIDNSASTTSHEMIWHLEKKTTVSGKSVETLCTSHSRKLMKNVNDISGTTQRSRICPESLYFSEEFNEHQLVLLTGNPNTLLAQKFEDAKDSNYLIAHIYVDNDSNWLEDAVMHAIYLKDYCTAKKNFRIRETQGEDGWILFSGTKRRHNKCQNGKTGVVAIAKKSLSRCLKGASQICSTDEFSYQLESPTRAGALSFDAFQHSADGREVVRLITQNGLENAHSVNESLYLGKFHPDQTKGKIVLEPQNTFTASELKPEGWEGDPSFSPDGKWIAFLSSESNTDETDNQNLLILKNSSDIAATLNNPILSLTKNLDRTITSFQWSCNSTCIIASYQNQNKTQLLQFNLGQDNWDTSEENSLRLLGDLHIDQFTIDDTGKKLITLESNIATSRHLKHYSRTSITAQFKKSSALSAEKSDEDLTISEHRIPAPSNTLGYVPTTLIKPDKCTTEAPCPLILAVHGGPNGVWNNTRHIYLHQIARQGYVIALPNPTGSIGYGQEFTNDVKHNATGWGGNVYTDLVKTLKYFIDSDATNFDFIDPARVHGMGESFGGFMMNYFRFNSPKFTISDGNKFAFTSLIVINGVWDLVDFACNTDQHWFPNDQFDLHASVPDCEKHTLPFNPVDMSKSGDGSSIPTLVIFSEKDVRVPAHSNSKELVKYLHKKKICTARRKYTHSGHSFSDEAKLSVAEQSINWLNHSCGDGSVEETLTFTISDPP